MNNSKSTDQRRTEFLARFDKMGEKQQTVHMMLAVRWLTALIKRREAMDLAAMNCTPKQLEKMA